MTPQADTIQLAHGGGGRLSRDLIAREILPRFGKGPLASLPDAANLPPVRGRLVFTTDSYVVQPLEFPGGNIGHLAVHGTVNDLAVSGARPLYLSLGLILEEGLPFPALRMVLDAIRKAADDCGVAVVTGDTKVVGHGQCDGLYVNTAGIGEALDGFSIAAANIRQGDAILVSGPLGDHGCAVLSARKGIEIANGPVSDTAPVHRLVLAIREQAAAVRFMRDPTRGGLAAVLNEAAADRSFGFVVDEALLPFSPGVKAVSEMLGLDPLQAASEGRIVLVCDAKSADGILRAWQALPEGRRACLIGRADGPATRVVLATSSGGRRLIDLPRGELLPRIC